MSITFPYKFHEVKENNFKLVYQITYKDDNSIFLPINCNSEQDIIASALIALDRIYPRDHSQFQIYLVGNYHSLSKNTIFKSKPELLCTFSEIAVIEKFILSSQSNTHQFMPELSNTLIMRDACNHHLPIKLKNTFPKLIGSNTDYMNSECSKLFQFPLKQINMSKDNIH